MGDYTKQLSGRFLNSGPDVGYCAICRTYEKLSKDHVPPKSCGNVSDVVIRDVYGSNLAHSEKNLPSQGGLHFKTICGSCNSTLLGTEYDPALSSVIHKIQSYLIQTSESRLSLPKTQLFEYQPNRFLRSVLGHLLAANAVSDTRKIGSVAPLDAALRAYLLDSSSVLPESVHVYYWLYPYRRQVIMKHCCMGFHGTRGDLIYDQIDMIYGHVFKFFPFGFWIVWNEQANCRSRSINLKRLDLDTSPAISATGRLSISFLPLQLPDFPEAPADDRMWWIADHLASQAAPKGKAR